jgi:hypothetical protein
MIITTTVENKRYTLDKFEYNLISEAIYVQFKIEILDGEDILKTYYYGYNISPEMVTVVLTFLQQNFQTPMVNKLVELNA